MATGFVGGYPDLLPGVMASGIDVLAQSVARRLVTPLGSSQDAPNDGMDLRSLVSQGMTAQQVAKLPGQIQGQVLKDVRVLSCDASGIVFNPATSVLTVPLNISSNAGPFTLTLSVTSVTVSAIVASQ